LEALAQSSGVPLARIGAAGGESYEITGFIQAPVAKLGDLFFTSVEKMMS
jgi:hypothetical protein